MTHGNGLDVVPSIEVVTNPRHPHPFHPPICPNFGWLTRVGWVGVEKFTWDRERGKDLRSCMTSKLKPAESKQLREKYLSSF
jgi:hypothetical protein